MRLHDQVAKVHWLSRGGSGGTPACVRGSRRARVTATTSRQIKLTHGPVTLDKACEASSDRVVACARVRECPWKPAAADGVGVGVDAFTADSSAERECLGCRDRSVSGRREDGFGGQPNVIAVS